MEIKQNLTKVNFNSAKNKINKYIVVHYTANSTDTAYNNTKYFKDVYHGASANYFVDDNEIYQCVLDKNIAWHCGDSLKKGNGGAYYGKCSNSNSIGIEMCCHNYDVSAKTEARTVELVKFLMSKYNIPADRVIRHFDVTNKICPKPMVIDGNRWSNFKKSIGGKAINIPTQNTSNNTTNKGITGDIIYQTHDKIKKQWLPEVVNDRDYAGNKNNDVDGLRAKPVYGEIFIQARLLNGKWLEPISSKNYAKNSNNGNSYAGIIGKPIDGIKIWSTEGHVDYRVGLKGNVGYLPWVHKADNTNEGYAGIRGRIIDRVQMK